MKTVSAKTVSNEVGLIKEISKHGCQMEYVKNDPSEHVKRPRTERARIEILSPPEIERLLAKINRKYRLAFVTCVLTGLRAGELWALRWSDIDWNVLQVSVIIRTISFFGSFYTGAANLLYPCIPNSK